MNAPAHLRRLAPAFLLAPLALVLGLALVTPACKDEEEGIPWGRFIVTTDASKLPDYVDCRIRPADTMYEATHEQAFGPASKEECRAWVEEHCE